MPIKKFIDYLYAKGELDTYMNTLLNAFNPKVVDEVMCTNTINVDWRGMLDNSV